MANVDVIVPCYNYGRFLPDCVGSILAQADLRLRVLVIDDASSDGSAEIARGMARRDQRITVAVHAKNYGHIATYNEGLDWARSDYLLLLSADDVLAPGSLRRAVEVMEAHPDVGLTYGKVIRLTGAEKPVLPHATPDRFSYALTDGPRFLEAFCASPTNSVETATAVVRTSVQKRVGGYRPELPHAGDLEMWLRFAAVGQLAFIDEVQAFARQHAHNMRNNYAAARMAGDFEQRAAALKIFFDDWGHTLLASRRLAASAWRKLSEEILWTAIRAFEEGEPEFLPRLAYLARTIDPEIVLTTLWSKLALRRLVGTHCWNWISPLLRTIRWSH